MFVLAPAAQAARPGVQRTTYKLGPLNVTPGQNRIGLAPGQRRMRNRPVVGKPKVDGWIVRIKPNLTYMDGSIPSSDRVMFHHGVWVNMSGNATSPLPERFFAAGEEKTIMKLPKGFGYHYRASDRWLLNHMIHNLTTQRMRLYITYTIDFIPESSAAARGICPVRPIWMDVENGRGYPVFDSFKGSGKNGRFTYPSDRKNAYPNGDIRPRHRHLAGWPGLAVDLEVAARPAAGRLPDRTSGLPVVRAGHDDDRDQLADHAYFDAIPEVSACCRSAIKSSASSIPIDSRTVRSEMPAH